MRSVIVYFAAVLLAITAGVLQIRLGDLLVTALFVLLSTLVMGTIHPHRAWQWTVIVGAGVPLVQLAALIFVKEWAYRAQWWEGGLGFLTGIAGAYSGAFARKAVEDLFFPNRASHS